MDKREMALIDVTLEGLVVKEIAADTSIEAAQTATEPRLRISPQLKVISI